jgi:hypothetical protein
MSSSDDAVDTGTDPDETPDKEATSQASDRDPTVAP